MDFEFFGGFDDDLFDNNSKKLEENLAEQIETYQAKNVDHEVFLDEKINSEETENSVHLLKIQGDYYYFKKDYEKSLQLYKQSLDLANKSRNSAAKPYHDKKLIRDKEVSESMTRCLTRLNRFDEALEIAENILNLESTSLCFDALSTSLNLKMDTITLYRTYLETKSDMNIINAELNTIEQLITLHPLFCHLWIKLGNSIYSKLCAQKFTSIDSKRDYLACYLITSQLHERFFAFRGEIVQKQKQLQKDWLIESESNLKKMNINLSKLDSGVLNIVISEKLDRADKFDDLERQALVKNLQKHEQFAQDYFGDLFVHKALE